MPLLPRETDTFPDNLFSLSTATDPWLVIHVRSRQEKILARHLLRAGIPFYLPQVEKATKRAGRTFRSFAPLFPGCMFARGSAQARAAAWQSEVAADILPVEEQKLIDDELRQLRELQLSRAVVVDLPRDAVSRSAAVRD